MSIPRYRCSKYVSAVSSASTQSAHKLGKSQFRSTFIYEMDDSTIVVAVSEFLSLLDLVELGSCSRDLQEIARSSISLRMRLWKKCNTAEDSRLSADEPDEFAFQTENAYENASLDWRRRSANQRIQDLQYKAYLSVLSMPPPSFNTCYLALAEARQGGPILVTLLHFAAATDDLQLCSYLLARGATVNPNIFIPCDKNSFDKSPRAANKDDGSDISQYMWGVITPLRIAITFCHHRVSNFLSRNGGDACREVQVETVVRTGNALLDVRLGPRVDTIGRGSCWVGEKRRTLFYKNTYMHDAIFRDILFTTDLPTSFLTLPHGE